MPPSATSQKGEPIARRTRLREREIKSQVFDIQHQWDQVDLTQALHDSKNNMDALLRFVADTDLVRMDCDPKTWKIQAQRQVGGSGYLLLEVCVDAQAADSQRCDFVVKMLPFIEDESPVQGPHFQDALREFIFTRIAGEHKIGPKVYDAFVCDGESLPKMVGDARDWKHRLGGFAGCLFMVMANVDGVTIVEYITEEQEAGLTPLNRVLQQVKDKVEVLHKLGIVHGDLHTGNVLVDLRQTYKAVKRDPVAWIIDFGTAHIYDPAEDTWSDDWYVFHSDVTEAMSQEEDAPAHEQDEFDE